MKVPIVILLFTLPLMDADPLFLTFGMFERIPGYFKEDNLPVIHDQFGNVGVWIYIIEWLSQYHNFAYEIVPMLGKEAGRPVMINGSQTWNGGSGRLLNREFDVLGPPVLLSLARFRSFDFAGIGDEEKSALFVPTLTEQSPIFSTLRPFKPSVWILLLISLLSIAICFTAVSAIDSNRKQLKIRSARIDDHAFNSLAILMNQGEVLLHFRNRYRLPFRLTNAAWCFFAVVMVNLYSSTLTSYITIRKTNLPPRDSIQVIEEGIFDFLVVDEGFGREIIMSATSGPLKKMGDIFRRKPENFVPSVRECFAKVASGCCACSDQLRQIEYLLGKDYKETGKCRVHIGKPQSGYSSIGLLLQKGSKHSNMINEGFLTLYQTGLVDYWRKKFVRPEAAACQHLSKRTKKLRRLNLRDLASAFFILGLGYLVSFSAFFIEQFRRCNFVYCLNK